jgi:hypothetical protein
MKLSNKERIEKGHLLARVIIEMLGAPKEHIEDTMKKYIESLKDREGVEVNKTYIAETELREDKKLYSNYADLEIWFDGIDTLLGFCFDALPSSVEIIEPAELKFKANKLNNLINDLQAKLHKVDMVIKNRNAEQAVAAKNFKTIIDNFVMYAVKDKPKKADELAKVIGFDKERIEKWADELAQAGIITKKDDVYSKK